MKKGFTLVEIITAIVILGIIGMIVSPVVNNTIKKNRESLYQTQLQTIKTAAEQWAYKNIDLLPSAGETITITLLELKKSGDLPLNIRDPRDNELMPNDLEIIISLENNQYVYNINEESGEDTTNEFNENSPILILNGNAIEYAEYGAEYQELGAKAKDKIGNTINEINITYQYNGIEISSINTSEFKTYTIVYSASSTIDGKNYTSKVTRTLVVRDTTAPELTIPGTTDITLNSAATFDLLEGVSVTDNSREIINITTSNYEPTLGQKIISYTACDSHNNCTTKKRIINIVSE